MSNSESNQIGLRESFESIEGKLRIMSANLARVRRDEPGKSEKCPVWLRHKVYRSTEAYSWVRTGPKTAENGQSGLQAATDS